MPADTIKGHMWHNVGFGSSFAEVEDTTAESLLDFGRALRSGYNVAWRRAVAGDDIALRRLQTMAEAVANA